MNSEISFQTLGLSSQILETIEKKGFKFASEIQAKSIPVILEKGHDIVGIAQTGTGKTAAFGLPIMDRLISQNQAVQCIILTPTRELAIQVAKELDSFKGRKKIKTIPVYGGQPIGGQIHDLKRGVDIVVGTPGRVMDLIQRKVLNLSRLEYFVLDEADEMLNMGFIEDIETILEATPAEKRVFLYSATMPPKIQSLSRKYMKEQVVLEVKAKNVKRDNIEQVYYPIRRSEKLEAIKNIIELTDGFHGIIFCQTKAIVNEISDALKKEKLDVDCIHGDISQDGREKILKKFRAKRLNILVATDVAARGLDVEDLTHVINYSLPKEIESYVHRIGRTGRAGKKGMAITFIDPRETYKINRLVKATKNDIVLGKLPSAAEVEKKKQARLVTRLTEIITTKDTTVYQNISEMLTQSYGGEKVVAALLYQINGSGVVKKPKVYKEERGDKFSRASGRGGNALGRSRRSRDRKKSGFSYGDSRGGSGERSSGGGNYKKNFSGDFSKRVKKKRK